MQEQSIQSQSLSESTRLSVEPFRPGRKQETEETRQEMENARAGQGSVFIGNSLF